MEGFFMIGIWIAILSGTLMSIQGVWNTQVTKQSSLWVSTGWVQLTAFLVCLAAWFLQEEIRLEHCGRLKTNIHCLEEFWEHLSL